MNSREFSSEDQPILPSRPSRMPVGAGRQSVGERLFVSELLGRVPATRDARNHVTRSLTGESNMEKISAFPSDCEMMVRSSDPKMEDGRCRVSCPATNMIDDLDASACLPCRLVQRTYCNVLLYKTSQDTRTGRSVCPQSWLVIFYLDFAGLREERMRLLSHG